MGWSMEWRFGELEQQTDDLDLNLIRITVIHDERDDWVSTLEGVAEVLDEWCP